MIEVDGLTKQYRSLVAVRDLTFRIGKGSVVGLLGSNGAGKTTTLRLLAGVLGATHGAIRLCGHDLVTQPIAARRCLGYLPETSPLYPDVTARQYLAYRSELKGIAAARRKQNLVEVAMKAGCEVVLDSRIRKLSRGYRQRIGIADALLADPPILLLDEPTAGLDPNQVSEVRDLIPQLRDEHAIIISTHSLTEVQSLCTHALVLHEGRLLANDTIVALQSRHTGAEIELKLSDPEHQAAIVLAAVDWTICDGPTAFAEKPDATGPLIELRVRLATPHPDTEEAIERAVAALVAAGIGVRRVCRVTPNLESVFSSLTQPDRASR